MDGDIVELQDQRKRKLQEINLLNEEISELDGKILLAKKRRLLNWLGKSGAWNYLETVDKAAAVFDVIGKLARGELKDGRILIALFKGGLTNE